ncbi:hypothetical protein [Nonomuraea maritima]|uniref:hypothetical protein n=1 Tax=Nonomuraea maritima TaxID=683260 RepID=UPI00371EE3AB
MIAVVVSLVAVVLLVLVVVALGMRSMSRRESSLPPERLKEMAEKEEMTQTRSTDQFAAHEPRMANFSPDFSPIDEPKPKPVRTGQRGRRGVDEWGNPTTDSDDEEFWANIRSDAEEGGFGAGGTVAARKAAPSPAPSPAPTPSPVERPAAEPLERPRSAEPLPERPARRSARRSAPRPAAASVDPDATTVQGPLPQRQPAPAPAGLADLVDPSPRPVPSQAELAEQRTVTFAAPTPDVMTILGAGAQPVPAPTRREPAPAPRPAAATTSGSFPAGSGSYGSGTGTPAAPGSGSFPATPTSGAFPATGPTTSGNFPVAGAPIHGAPTSDPFPAYGGTDALDTTAAYSPTPAATTSGSWPASPDIFDDAPAAPAAPAPAYTQPSSWPAFEQPTTRSSYEVSAGWAVADDAEPTTGPSPATGTPTAPNRAVSAYDDVLSAPTPPQSPFTAGAYETGDVTTTPGGGAAWPAPPASETSGNWPAYDPQQDTPGNERSRRRRAPEQDYPHDYYR